MFGRDFRNRNGFSSFRGDTFTSLPHFTIRWSNKKNYFQMISFVLVIPKHTLNAMRLTWLSLKNVGKLDAALCDSSCRDVFEHSLALRKLSKVSDALYSNLCFIRWVLKRKEKFGAWCI